MENKMVSTFLDEVYSMDMQGMSVSEEADAVGRVHLLALPTLLTLLTLLAPLILLLHLSW